MADFTLDEFIGYLNELNLAYPSLDINPEKFRLSVERDIGETIRVREGESFRFKRIVPEKYNNKELEFLITYHFKKQFLDGIWETEYIIETFKEDEEVASIVLIGNQEFEHDRINIKETDMYSLSLDKEALLTLFFELGKILLGSNFNPNEFINRG